MKKPIDRIINVIKTQGLLKLIFHFSNYLQWKYHRFSENRFDKKYNVDTLQTSSDYFESAITDNTAFAVPYEPIQHHIFKDMLAHTTTDGGNYTFIDLGSGKGRALLFATNYQFKRIIGVEFSRDLHAIAEKNVHNYLKKTKKNHNIELYCIDVVDFNLPATNLVIFLYNPFFGSVMSSVVDKLTEFLSLRQHDLYILYRNPQCADFLDNHKLLDRCYSTRSYSIYRNK
jgi:predicted RNA methylase